MALSTSSPTIRVVEYDQDPTPGQHERGESASSFLLDESRRHSGQEYLVHLSSDAVLVTPFHRSWGTTPGGTTVSWGRSLVSSLSRLPQRLRQFMCDLLLPVGYPATVRPGYKNYQCYDSLQGLCSYLRGVLCHAAVLEAAGVGNAEATAWAAATTWALKDGVAMVGGLAYSYMVANQLDAYVKEFRLFADVANDVGFLLDMMAPWFGHEYFLHVSSAAVLCKTLCGISAGATKGSITLHFAVAGNMADLNAKEATQETLVSLVGMILGVYAARTLRALDQYETLWNWSLFLVLTIIHVWANYQGVSLLRLRTLNRARTDVVLAPLVQHVVSSDSDHRTASALLVPPDQVHESLWYAFRYLMGTDRLKLGMPLTLLIQQSEEHSWMADSTERYRVAILRCKAVGISLLTGATPRDQFKAYVHGLLIVALRDGTVPPESRHATLIQTTQSMVDKLCLDDWLVSELRLRGWDVDGPVYLGFGQRRSHCSNHQTLETKKEK